MVTLSFYLGISPDGPIARTSPTFHPFAESTLIVVAPTSASSINLA